MSKERKIKIITSLLLLLSLIIGVSYAFFQAQLEGEDYVEIHIQAKTIDVLTFNVAEDFSFDVNEESFARGKGNITHDMTATASLIANNKTNKANYKYYLYLFIPNNTLDYTKSPTEPELLLNVYGPDGYEIENIANLNYINGRGYDITKTNGLITISNDEIESTSSTETTDEIWRFKITLINLESNQVANAGKNFRFSVIMKSEPLEDISLASICKGQEIASCISDNYNLDNSIIYQDGLADSEEEANFYLESQDESYNYYGLSDDVNNYVCLDGTTTSGTCQTENDLYRIIGFFKNNEKYEAKLIKATFATTNELGESGAYCTNNTYSWNNILGKTEDFNDVNMWKESNLNKDNLNNFYYNYITKKVHNLAKYISNHTWTVGTKFSAENTKTVFNNELGVDKLTNESLNCYDQGNSTTKRLCNLDNDLTYNANIGLMYISNYMYATTPNNWTVTAGNYNLDDVKKYNWMYIEKTEWTISRSAANGHNARYIASNGSASGAIDIHNCYGIRPVFYLTSSTKLASGSGSHDNPYRLKLD